VTAACDATIGQEFPPQPSIRDGKSRLISTQGNRVKGGVLVLGIPVVAIG
jgi:hypothetical protein